MRALFLLIGSAGLVSACAPALAPTVVSSVANATPTVTVTATATMIVPPSPPTNTPTATPVPLSTPTASPTIVISAPNETPAPTRAPVIPRRGDIIAETTDGKYIVIRQEGGEEEIDQKTFWAFSRDAAVAVDHSFRLEVSDNHRVMNVPLDRSLRAGGTVAIGEKRKILVEHLVAVDNLGFYAAVVQQHREVLLFEAIDAHHQGVIFTIPENFVRIESIFWGVEPPRNRDILLVLRDIHGTPGIYWLSPGAHIYEAPDRVRQECYHAPRLLTDCLIRYNRSLPRSLTLVRENAFHAIVVW